MINGYAAGHSFKDGICETGTCRRRWVDIRNCTVEDLEKPGIAHTGNLVRSELDSIEKLRAKEDAALAAAFGW